MLSSDTLTLPKKPRFGLSSSTLKIIACVTMVIDHVGAYLIIPSTSETHLLIYYICRAVGRISFPIFAFCIAQGCRYTRNKVKRFLLVFGLGAICEVVFRIYSGKWDGNILLTFSCSILVIYAVQAVKMAMVRRDKLLWVIACASLCASVAFSRYILRYLPLDYGFYGILLPAFAVLPDYKEGEAPAFFKRVDRHSVRYLCFAAGLLLHWWMRSRGWLQAFSLLALIPLALYNGQPGRKGWKYGFYIFYPAHLLLIGLIGVILYG